MPTLVVGMLVVLAIFRHAHGKRGHGTRVFVIFLCFLFASSASAHGIHVTASVDGKTIHGRVTFQGGAPVKNCTITGHDAADGVLAQSKTDDDGGFSLEAKWRCDYHIEAETDDGHGGEYVLKAALLPSDLPLRENLPAAEISPAESAHRHAADDTGDENPWTVEQIRNIQAKLDAQKEKIDAYESSIRVRDVLGGIGYIFGVFGLYAVAVNYQKRHRVERRRVELQ
jgi:nickel transport protein